MDESLREQLDLLKALLDECPTCVWVKDEGGNILWCNQSGARAGGTTPSQMEGTNQDDWWPSAWTRKWTLDDREVLRAGRAKRNIIETLRHPKTGQVRWVRTDKIPMLGDDGTVVAVAVYSVDLTDHIDLDQMEFPA